MAKIKRISVPVSREIERELRTLSAENGRSTAANLCDLIEAGLQKNDVEQQLAELKTLFQNHPQELKNNVEILNKIESVFAEFCSEIQQNTPASKTESGVLLPEKASLLLFEEVLFSSFLSNEIVSSDLPGTPPKPAGQHIRNARQKAKTALTNFMSACRED